MWLLWGKRSLSRSRSTNFSCSSFKDVQTLCTEEDNLDHQQPNLKRQSSIFHRIRVSPLTPRRSDSKSAPAPEPECVPSPADSEGRVVVYFTSLRIVRRTFEDCRAVRHILRGLHVWVDERDLSMDTEYLEEIQRLFKGEEEVTLPRVFVGGKYVGGAEEVRQMHECGELKKLVEGLRKVDPGVCDHCGGFRFVLCHHCNGSHKCFWDHKNGFRNCFACNVNGLIRCSQCTSVSL